MPVEIEYRPRLEENPARVWTQRKLSCGLDATIAAWRSWSALHQAYEGPWRELVHGSGRVLQALSFQPSGAIVAVATTSLPEGVGGERNWDYRFAWVRGASLTMSALWVAACPDEASDFFAFLITAPSLSKDRVLQIVFGIGREHDLSERPLPHLHGWRDSRPIRVGNEAWKQQQIDVYEELLDAAHRLAEQISDIDEDVRRFLIACADTAAERWMEKESWRRTREDIRTTVLREGWDEHAGAFTQYFGSPGLDASTLMMAIVGFLPADDPRMLATIEATEQRLTDDVGLVHRYRAPAGVDGLLCDEGAFLLCTFWLAHALALAGRTDRARTVLERAAAYANDLGLPAEEVDPSSGELLGNFPQAFSYIGLVNAAWAIAERLG